MLSSALTAISPIDGRYQQATKELSEYFSEFALIKYRVFVEIEYFIALSASGIPQLQPADEALKEKLRAIYL
ncbi:MAG TPA: adenylosuccinate lyase, partial [Sphingobacteriaceae bacterium]|nr:adenylosuccinate lyase [Sphingobacteriaceae bacterium]